MDFNIHTHTYRCMHASGTDEEYVQNALKQGIKVLGFSDHIAFKHRNDSGMRMKYTEVDEYIASITKLKEKYVNSINIYIGFESEYIPAEYDLYQEVFQKVDYLILGPHLYEDYHHYSSRINTPNQMESYYAMLEDAAGSGLFTYIAHPDIYMCSQKEFTPECEELAHRIARLSLQYDIPLEYNLEGLRNTFDGRIWQNGTNIGYPRPEFWKVISSYPVKVILGADAHDPHVFNDKATYKGLELVKSLN